MKKINSPFFQDQIRKTTSSSQSPVKLYVEPTQTRPLQTLFRSPQSLSQSNAAKNVEEISSTKKSLTREMNNGELISQNQGGFHFNQKALTLLEVSNWKIIWVLIFLPIIFAAIVTFPNSWNKIHKQVTCTTPFHNCIQNEQLINVFLNLTSKQLIRSRLLLHVSDISHFSSLNNMTITMNLLENNRLIYHYQSYLQSTPLGNETFVHYIPSVNAANFINDLNTPVMINFQIDSLQSFPVEDINFEVIEDGLTLLYLSCACCIVLTGFLLIFLIYYFKHCWSSAFETYSNFIQDYPFLPPKTFTPLHFALPEQFYSGFLSVLCILYIDPIGNGVILLNTVYQIRIPTFWIRLLSFIKFFGKIGIYFTLCCIVDGLKFTSNTFEEKIKWKEILDKLTRVPPTEYNKERLKEYIHFMFNLYLTKHHVLSSQITDFIIGKFLFWFLSLVCNFAFNFGYIRLDFYFQIDYYLFLLWLIYLVKVFMRTNSVLLETRYLKCRHRQLMFKILNFQLFLYLFAISGFSLFWNWNSIHSITSEPWFPPRFEIFNDIISYLKATEFATEFHAQSTLCIISYEAIFLVGLVLSISISSFPSRSAPVAQDYHRYLTFKSQLPSFKWTSISQPMQYHQPFCLELACYLLEASYQAYFPPAYQNESISIESATCSFDINRLGLNLIDVFYCPNLRIFGYVSDSRSDIVVAFRGSTSENIPTDFMFSQISLPNLIRNPDFFFKALGKENMCTHESEPLPSLESRSIFQKCLSCLPLVNQNFPMVHFGFWRAYASIREKFLISMTKVFFNRLVKCAEELSTGADNYDLNLDCNIHFSGHSLGAAIASFAVLELSINMKTMIESIIKAISEDSGSSTDIARIRIPPLTLYTYGSPRVGNNAFSRLIEQKVSTIYRIKVNGDLVTMVPKILGFYNHFGTPVILDEFEKGNILIQPTTIEDSFFRNSVGYVGNHSLEKYRLCLEACFEPEEFRDYVEKEFRTNTMVNV